MTGERPNEDWIVNIQYIISKTPKASRETLVFSAPTSNPEIASPVDFVSISSQWHADTALDMWKNGLVSLRSPVREAWQASS